MSQLRGTVHVRLDQAGEDEAKDNNVRTCFGLPGNNGVQASMSSCHFDAYVAVYDDLSVYLGINGEISDPVVASHYEVILCVSPDDWEWQYYGGSLHGPSSNWSADVQAYDGSGSNAPSWAGGQSARDASRHPASGRTYGWFRWQFSCSSTPNSDNASGAGNGYIYIGKLTDYHGNDQDQDGYIYLGGTGTYYVEDPLYPDPYRITVPGFMRFLDYYPFAVRKSGQWMSCNRSGGSTTIRKSGSWRDVKNVVVGQGNDHAFIRSGSSWEVAPEIGSK